MAKSVKVKLSLMTGRIRKLIQFGREHRIRTSAGTIKKAAVAKRIVDETLDIRFDPVYAKIIEKEGVNMMDMTKKLWKDYAIRHGYLKNGNHQKTRQSEARTLFWQTPEKISEAKKLDA